MSFVITTGHYVLDERGSFLCMPFIDPDLGPYFDRRYFTGSAAAKDVFQLAAYAIVFENVFYVMHDHRVVVAEYPYHV